MKLFVPGRICLFGEHSDWAGGYRRINAEIEKGYTLICGTDQGIYAEVEPHPTSLVMTSTTPDGESCGPYEIPMEPKALLEEAQKGGFWSYIAGVAYQVLTNYHVRGLVIDNYQTDLPIKKGLSSSAAICVLAARAFNRVYDLKLTVRGEMELAYQGEITTPSRCGRMDQGCAFGNRPVLMTFDGDRLDTNELQVKKELYFVVVDLQAHKDTLEILNRLNRCYPVAENEIERGVQELLGPINKRIVSQAIEALKSADGARLGESDGRSAGFLRPLCHARLPGRADRAGAAPRPGLRAAQAAYLGRQGRRLAGRWHRAVPCPQRGRPAGGDRNPGSAIWSLPALKLTLRPSLKVRKAVIPAAGFGTRLFPGHQSHQEGAVPDHRPGWHRQAGHPADRRRSPGGRHRRGHHHRPGR